MSSFQIVLNSLQNTSKSPRHKQNNSSPSKELRKLRIQLGDRVFQLKKQEQDFAQDKARLLQSHNQQRNNLTMQIKELYSRINFQNEHWAQKIDELRKQNQVSLSKLNDQWTHKFRLEVNFQIKEILKRKFYSFTKNLAGEVNSIKLKLKQMEIQTKRKVFQLKEISSTNLRVVQDYCLNILKNQKLNSTQEQRLRMQAIMHIKKDEQKQHSKTKKLLYDHQQKFQQLQNQFNQLTCNQKQQRLKNLLYITNIKQQNELLKEKVSKLTLKSQQHISTIAKGYQEKQLESTKIWEQNIDQLNQKWKSQFKKLQSIYEKMQYAHSQKQKLWDLRANKVLDMFEKKQAREEDVKLIENLEIQLIRKQFELEREKQELKSAKLELDNMDEIYKRVFYTASHHHSYSIGRHNNSESFHLKKIKLPGIVNRSTHPIKNKLD